MLHGGPADHQHMMHDFEPIFEGRPGWKRVYLDLPGMGLTPASNFITNRDEMLELVLGFIDRVMPGERFVVVGNSYGGYLARGLVYRRAPHIDGLCLIVPQIVPGAEEDTPPVTTLVENPDLRAEFAGDELVVFDALTVQSQEVVSALQSIIFPAFRRADLTFFERLSRPENTFFSFEVDALAEPFPAPALFLMGRQDSWVGYQDAWRIVENYPRATFAVLDRTSHFLAYEQKVLFRPLVAEWLDRVEEYAAPL